jgi:hypothetical protein
MNDTIEIVDENFQSRFFLKSCKKYVTYSCLDSCWNGKFCNSCWDFPNNLEEPLELQNNEYTWETKKNKKKLVHHKIKKE